MIVDKLKNSDTYKNIHPLITQALDIAKGLNVISIEGKTNVNENMRYSISTVNALPVEEKNFEAHQKYIDIHIVLDGVETVGFGDLEDCKEVTPFDTDKDIGFYSCDSANYITITKGMFYITFFDDAHMPNVYHSTNTIKKVVFKIKL